MTSAPTILFDEAHSEAWTIRPALAQTMQPAHPGDSSYALAAAALGERGYVVRPNIDGALTANALASVDAVVIAHPSDPAWERTTGTGSPVLTGEEIDALEAFVAAGGGLVVLGETEQAKYGNNVNTLLAHFGIQLDNETVQDYQHNLGAPTWIRARLGEGDRGLAGDLLSGVGEAVLYRATTISMIDSDPPVNGRTAVLARAHDTATAPGAPLIVAAEHGAGRVVVLADSDLFGDDCLGDLHHRRLWLNIADWVSAGATATSAPGLGDGTEQTAEWRLLRDQTNALALLQQADGALAPDADRAAASAHVDAIAGALRALAPRFPHQSAYLEAVLDDLGAWACGGFAKPDFTRALDGFRPERVRQDGIRHLVFFPMYKQNGSRETCFEALLVRVPWPAWIAELERSRYGNPKFVPVQLIDATRGYDSDCAVLFPETVSVAGRPVNNFGGIFCDREAERLRRIGGAAIELLSLNLPPDCARMLRSPELSEQTYILWDLIHDRAHSHGELPFDPFMIRQRAPYWMYSLEELRCDLTAFMQARALEAEGREHGRYVQYAIVLDRLLRFPIAGTRVRNYDGLGGQLLFAHLHGLGHVRWEDNRLTIDWDQVGDGVAALYAEVIELYRRGIDRTKLGHWAAAHDLVASRVAPASGSHWAKDVRVLDDDGDPRRFIDEVLPDEFPLSIFYTQLQAKVLTSSAL